LSSLPDLSFLKPRQSTELNVKSANVEDFTTAVLTKLVSMQFGGWGVGAKITNNDGANEVIYRLHTDRGISTTRTDDRTVPINSSVTINEWFDVLIIIPDATAGTGQLELDYVTFADARKVRV